MMMKFRPVKGRRIREAMRGREKEWRRKSGGMVVTEGESSPLYYLHPGPDRDFFQAV